MASQIAPLTLEALNVLDKAGFVAALADIAEHAPWMAAAVFTRRPFDCVNSLATAFEEVIDAADEKRQQALIRAHPDLAGRAAIAGDISATSRREQAGAGLDRLTPGEYARFQRFNDRYRDRFGFPFILAIRGLDKQSILAAFEQRLLHDEEAEFATALTQVKRIVRLRLQDRVRVETAD